MFKKVCKISWTSLVLKNYDFVLCFFDLGAMWLLEASDFPMIGVVFVALMFYTGIPENRTSYIDGLSAT